MAFMFLRVVFIVNLYKQLTPWQTMPGFRALAENNLSSHFALHLRDGLQKKPYLTFGGLFVISVLTLSYILRIFERPFYYSAFWNGAEVTSDAFINLSDSIWCTIITMTTVGYGDVYAITTFGRWISMIAAIAGTIMISLLVATMSTHLKLNPHETKVINEIEERALAA
jgi:hypothetical protein